MSIKSKQIFLDTNVLIYQTFEDFDEEKHKTAATTLEFLYNNGFELYISAQIIREFLAISTNGKIFEKPLSIENAIEKSKEFQDNFTVLFENGTSLNHLQHLALTHHICKREIHDVNIAATMLANGIKDIFTFNEKDFSILKEISIFQPANVLKAELEQE